MLIAFLIWMLCAVAAGMIGASKGIGGLGFILGFVFGPFGILFVAIMQGDRRECPACRMKIHPEAMICPMCRTAITNSAPRPSSDPREWRGTFQDQIDTGRSKLAPELDAATVKWIAITVVVIGLLIGLAFIAPLRS